eukprot:m.25652 g.25652  ORF g.25652 m.25652 type:complete len:55 (-) comp7726_c0_seq2:326-490(-)
MQMPTPITTRKRPTYVRWEQAGSLSKKEAMIENKNVSEFAIGAASDNSASDSER